MRTRKGGGVFNRIKGFFTRKKKPLTKVNKPQSKSFSEGEKIRNEAIVYPRTNYPMFPQNQRREAVPRLFRIGTSEYKRVKRDYNEIKKGVEKEDLYTKKINKKTMSPATADTPPSDIILETLGIEPFGDGMRRILLFFYNEWRAAQKLPGSPQDLYATNDEMNELIYFCKRYRYTKYPELLKEYMTRNEVSVYTEGDQERASLDLFGQPLNTLNLEIQKTENVNHVYPSYNDPTVFQFANAYGSYLERYYPFLTHSLRQIIYSDDKAEGYNKASPQEINRPIIKSLNSYYSICCFIDSSHFFRFIEQGVKGCSHYIILNSKHIPNVSITPSREIMPIPIVANKFLSMSFIQDAFQEQGVDTMDEDLFTLLQKEAAGLVNSAKVTITTPDSFEKLTVFDHFMILTEEALPEKTVISYRNPLLLSVVRRAFDENRQILLLDPFTAYCTKKKNPRMWSKAFGEQVEKLESSEQIEWDPNLDVYLMLRDVEKLYVDFCQYKMVVAKTIELNTESIESRLQKASELYKIPLQSKRFTNLLYSLASREEVFREFQEIQKNLVTYDAPLQTSEDILDLIDTISGKPRVVSNSPKRVSSILPPISIPLVSESQVVPEAQEENLKAKYDEIISKRGDEAMLKRQLNYFAKQKKSERNTKRLGKILQMERQTRKNYEFVRNFPKTLPTLRTMA